VKLPGEPVCSTAIIGGAEIPGQLGHPNLLRDTLLPKCAAPSDVNSVVHLFAALFFAGCSSSLMLQAFFKHIEVSQFFSDAGNVKNSGETRRSFADSTVLFLNLHRNWFAIPPPNRTIVFQAKYCNHESLVTFLIAMGALEGTLVTACFRNELMHRVDISLFKLKRCPRQLRAQHLLVLMSGPPATSKCTLGLLIEIQWLQSHFAALAKTFSH
jgi:hypothetical protein